MLARFRHEPSEMHTRRLLRQRGMTLLEIMIVLAILALVMGLVIGPKIMEHYRDSERQVARLAVGKIADETYPQWALSHRGDRCPLSVAELVDRPSDATDPWGTAYKVYCGDHAPAANIGFGAASFGEDRSENTHDDIRSWE